MAYGFGYYDDAAVANYNDYNGYNRRINSINSINSINTPQTTLRDVAIGAGLGFLLGFNPLIGAGFGALLSDNGGQNTNIININTGRRNY